MYSIENLLLEICISLLLILRNNIFAHHSANFYNSHLRVCVSYTKLVVGHMAAKYNCNDGWALGFPFNVRKFNVFCSKNNFGNPQIGCV